MVSNSSSSGSPEPLPPIDPSQNSLYPKDPPSILSSFKQRMSTAAAALTDTCSTLYRIYTTRGQRQDHSLRDRVAPLLSEEPSIQHIQDVASETFTHMAPLEEEEVYLDPHRLTKAGSQHTPITPAHFNWFLNQAIVLEHLDNPDPVIKARLSLLTLHAYGKAASIGSEFAQERALQITPLLEEPDQYHRSTNPKLLDKIDLSFSQDMGVSPHEMLLVDSLLFDEILSREFSSKHIDSIEDFEAWSHQILEDFSAGKVPSSKVILNISRLSNRRSPQEIKAFTKALEDIFIKILESHIKANPDSDLEEIAQELIAKLQIVSFCSYKEETVLITPEFLLNQPPTDNDAIKKIFSNGRVRNKHGRFFKELANCIKESGFRVSIDHAKEIWLKAKDITTIFEEEQLPLATLATKTEIPLPEIFPNYQSFFNSPIVRRFLDLSTKPLAAPLGKTSPSLDEKIPSYLRIMPEATVNLLRGFIDCFSAAGGIDGFFKDNGLSDLLNTFYFRIHNAMANAILYQNNPTKFINELELIHQEIQNILGIVQPYDEGAFSESIINRLTNGDSPVIQRELGSPRVHIVSSGMHAFSSILGGVEKEKQSIELNVAVLDDSYYESTGSLEKAKGYNLFRLNGDNFSKGIRGAFDKPPKPIDLFVCEFHHNVSTTRQSYKREDLLGQIKAMHAEGMLAKQCTIAIDTTINLENSSDFRELLNDPDIKQLIQHGALNIVLFRSAQKFDMLGMDNYSGGISITINNGSSFADFNNRLDDPSDQLRGLSYQGLTHLSLYGSDSIENYRIGIMNNLKFLYSQLPPDAIWKEGTDNPMQISEITDDELVFLDVKFPKNPVISKLFLKKFNEFALAKRLTLTSRASFGFVTSNIVSISEGKLRFTPGLDSEESLTKYADFFRAVQQTLVTTLSAADPSLSKKDLDRLLINSIETLDVSTIAA